MSKNIMVDLETLGTNSNSVIVAIGAVAFTKEDGIIDEFTCNFKLTEAMKYGKFDIDTIVWWLGQSDDAQSKLIDGEDTDIPHIMGAFHEFIGKYGDDVKVWGNGAAFDNVILSNLFEELDMTTPWEFWNDRCYRTMKALYSDVEFERVGIHHNAIDDAKSQALHLIKILKRIENV